MLTFAECNEFLAGKDRRRLANNTWLERVGDVFAVRLHSTDVVRIHHDGTYTLTSGGWRTSTTKNRINRYGPAKVHQKDHIWYVGGFFFFDGIRLDSGGRVLNADPGLAA